jgi:hypothetical protein
LLPHKLDVLPTTEPVKLVSSATATLLVDSLGDVFLWESGVSCHEIESQILGKLWDVTDTSQVLEFDTRIPKLSFELIEAAQGKENSKKIVDSHFFLRKSDCKCCSRT